MTTAVPGRDYTGANLPPSPLPGIQLASYITGSGTIPMSTVQEERHPGIVRIDQSPILTAIDETADVLDFENGAATLSDLVPWVKAAEANFAKGTRPGQRKPAIYASASSLPGIVNAMTQGGMPEGLLWVAHWGVGAAVAQNTVISSTGSFQIVGFQYQNTPTYDEDFFSLEWLNNVSKAVAPPPAPKPIEVTPAPDVIPVPSAAGIPAVVTWHGVAGLTARRTVFTPEQWDAIKWETQ